MQDNKSVSGVLCSSYDIFFDAEKKIADYMLGHKSEVIDMTVAELARASQTSDATVSRFCRRCGYHGFHHLKINLAKEVAEERSHISISNEIDRKDIPQSLENILANKIAELTQTVSMMEAGTVAQVLDTIQNARTVQLAAVGNTIPVALDGAFKLNQMGIAAVSGSVWESQLAYTYNLAEEDAVIIISNSGTSKRLQILAEGAKEKGAKVIAITNHSDSPLARLADYHLATATREKLLMEEYEFSRISAMTVIEILYLFLAADKKGGNKDVQRMYF